jgi:hypothetical protein
MTNKILQEVKDYARKVMDGKDPQHAYDHAERTAKNALRIVDLLKIKDMDLNVLQAACYLHDVPINMFHHNPAVKHWLENYAIIKFIPKVVDELGINGKEREILMNAIRRHTFTIPYGRLNRNGDVYLKIMQDADSIDFFSLERERSLNENKKRNLSYFMISLVSDRYFKAGRSDLGQYLNFPELAKHNWYNR